MDIAGFPDILLSRSLIKSSGDIREQLVRASHEAQFGLQADVTRATGGNVGGAHLLKKALDETDTREKLYSIVNTRVELTSKTLVSLNESAATIDVDILNALSTTGDIGVDTTVNDAESAIRKIFVAINSARADRSLFGGDVTDTSPLGNVDTFLTDIQGLISTAPTPADLKIALDTYFDDPLLGGFNTTIYQGGTGPGSGVDVGNGQRISYSVRADAPEIKNLLRGLSVIAATDSIPFASDSDEYTEILRTASQTISDGKVNIIRLNGSIGNTAELIEDITDDLAAEKRIFNFAYTSIVGRDEAEAAEEVKRLQVQLQTAHQLTALLSELSLVNFIR